MYRKMSSLASLAAVSILAIAAVAVAAVSFDPESGEGFVGKGDVQTAFGWNNKQLQDNAGGVTFSFNSSQSYEVECEWETGPEHNRKVHTVTRNESTGVDSEVVYEARKNSKGQQGPVTGFLLTGLGETVAGGDSVPEVGDPCPGNPGNDSTVVSVTPVGEGASGGLYASFEGKSVLIWAPGL